MPAAAAASQCRSDLRSEGGLPLATNRKRHRGPRIFPSRQTSAARAFVLRLRRIVSPIAPKPSSIIAQVDDSGTWPTLTLSKFMNAGSSRNENDSTVDVVEATAE